MVTTPSRVGSAGGADAVRSLWISPELARRANGPIFLGMFSETSTPPLCPICGEPMKFIKAVPHLGGLPEMFVFYCSRCKQAETKVHKQAI